MIDSEEILRFRETARRVTETVRQLGREGYDPEIVLCALIETYVRLTRVLRGMSTPQALRDLAHAAAEMAKDEEQEIKEKLS